MKEIRQLRADEIEMRVGTLKKDNSGASFLLYKDARCDMNILDETFGVMNWKREHTRENANCIVSIWCDEKKQWISKEDTGTESFTEKEKGLASDSFKRACFNWGIGRELYSAPFIWINLGANDVSEFNGKSSIKTKFHVTEIGYNENKEINKLTIVDDKKVVRYTYNENALKDLKPKSEPKKVESKINTFNNRIELDSYYSKLTKEDQGTLKTEYDNRTSLLIAVSEMNETKTQIEALNVWQKYQLFQINELLITAKEEAKKRFTK